MKRILFVLISSALAVGCSDVLDPLPNGHYTDGNYEKYPSVIRGFIDKSYSLLPTTYAGNEYAYLECATDNAVAREQTNVMRHLATGSLIQSEDPFAAWWGRDYEGIYYANRFLYNDLGLNTRYLTDLEADAVLRRNLQGEAYALRAWYELDLLRKFGGKAADGRYLGFPIVTEPVLGTDGPLLERATYEECLKQIVEDCDAAFEYLPLGNRNQLADDPTIQGARAWHRFDGITTVAIKAMAYLTWASPAFNPDGDRSRWEKAAEYAAQVMKFKLEVDGATTDGFDPAARFQWSDSNSSEIVFSSFDYTGSDLETLFYPNGFQGTGSIGITQELVDAFPMANGYPIDDERSNFDPSNPYENRDPRFYSTVFYHGAKVLRPTNSEVMYTFDMTQEGQDVADAPYNSPTNYYVRKFLYLGWNKADVPVLTLPRSIFFVRWTSMCLAFAEAANQVAGPTDDRWGFSAKDAIAYLRKRTTGDGMTGLGAASDPYLDACAAAGREAFAELIRNERRIELCFEGDRFFDLRRWAADAGELNRPVSRAVIAPTGDDAGAVYSSEPVENRRFASRWLPIPYAEMQRSPGMIQNEGWESWN